MIRCVSGVVDGGGTAKCTVFINDVAVEVAVGPINVPEAFGEEAMLIHSSGIPVVTDEWGFTLHPLQHGASYYLVCVVLATRGDCTFHPYYLEWTKGEFTLMGVLIIFIHTHVLKLIKKHMCSNFFKFFFLY